VCSARHRQTPLMLAYIRGHKPFVDMLLDESHVDVSIEDDEGNNIMHLAAGRGDVEQLAALLEYSKRDPTSARACDAPNSQGKTPLVFAACAGSAACCKLLLKNGCSLDVCASGGMSLLHCMAVACINGSVPFSGESQLIQTLKYFAKLHHTLYVAKMECLGVKTRDMLHAKRMTHLLDSKFASVQMLTDDAGLNALECALEHYTTYSAHALRCMRVLADIGCTINLDNKRSKKALLNLFAYLPLDSFTSFHDMAAFVEDVISEHVTSSNLKETLPALETHIFNLQYTSLKWQKRISKAAKDGILRRKRFVKIALLLPQQDIKNPAYNNEPIVRDFYRSSIFDVNVLKELLQYVW
jgi:hypothetical protein